MKIKFKKFEPTGMFIKLFGRSRHQADSEPEAEETGDVYEYYYKRGHTYYFRNSEGDKFTVNYEEPPAEFVRGNTYKVDAINNRDR